MLDLHELNNVFRYILWYFKAKRLSCHHAFSQI